jgi:hypothetical protein
MVSSTMMVFYQDTFVLYDIITVLPSYVSTSVCSNLPHEHYSVVSDPSTTRTTTDRLIHQLAKSYLLWRSSADPSIINSTLEPCAIYPSHFNQLVTMFQKLLLVAVLALAALWSTEVSGDT